MAIAGINKNGIFGNGNTQLIELLPPRYAGTNKTYTITVAADGEHFDEDNKIILRVNNEGINNELDFRDCSEKGIKEVKVNYVDKYGNNIAESDTYRGYSITMTAQFGIIAKEIEGYELESEPEIDPFVNGGATYNFVYRAVDVIGADTLTASLGYSKATYNGSYKKPSVTVKDKLGNVLVKDRDYVVNYTNNKYVGTAKAVIEMRGRYKGSIKKSFTINPKSTYITSRSGGRRSFTVKWKKQAVQTSGYQIRYSRYSSMKNAKEKTISKTGTVSSRVSKLARKKKYYVQVRTYKTVKGVKFYGAWSTKRSVKTR